MDQSRATDLFFISKVGTGSIVVLETIAGLLITIKNNLWYEEKITKALF
jgi:hypothetical protein